MSEQLRNSCSSPTSCRDDEAPSLKANAAAKALLEARGMCHKGNVLTAIQRIAILVVACSMAACGGPGLTGALLRQHGGAGMFKYDPDYGRANRQRDLEMRDFPARFFTDSLATESAILTNSQIFDMLTVRGLRFIEVKVRRPKGREGIGILGMIDAHDPKFETPLETAFLDADVDYVRIELVDGTSPDTRCIYSKSLPHPLKSRIDNPPLLPGTCISATPIKKPTARMAIAYDDKHPWGPPFGYWSLVDRLTGQKLASLTSADNPASPSNGNSGHRDLSMRVWNGPEFQREGHRALFEDTIKITLHSPDENSAVTVKPHNVRYIFVTEEEYNDLLHRGFRTEEWKEAVDGAMNSRWGYYGPYLLDWQTRTYTRLVFPDYRYATAAEKGFFAISGFWDHRTEPGTLERYDNHGKRLWSVLVSPPNMRLDERCGGGKAELGITKDYVVFYGRCGSWLPWSERPEPNLERKVMLTEIRRKDLPDF